MVIDEFFDQLDEQRLQVAGFVVGMASCSDRTQRNREVKLRADPLKRREFIPRSLSQRQGHPLFFSWRLSQCLLGFGCFGETALGLSVVLLASKVPLCPRWGLCPQ